MQNFVLILRVISGKLASVHRFRIIMRVTKPNCAKDRIILALDTSDLNEVRELVVELKDYVGYFKVGLQLLVKYGLEAVQIVKENGGKVYYDSKFHDIPNTVAHACASLVESDEIGRAH